MIKNKTDHKRVGFAIARQRLHPLDTVDFATRFRLGVYASHTMSSNFSSLTKRIDRPLSNSGRKVANKVTLCNLFLLLHFDNFLGYFNRHLLYLNRSWQ